MQMNNLRLSKQTLISIKNTLEKGEKTHYLNVLKTFGVAGFLILILIEWLLYNYFPFNQHTDEAPTNIKDKFFLYKNDIIHFVCMFTYAIFYFVFLMYRMDEYNTPIEVQRKIEACDWLIFRYQCPLDVYGNPPPKEFYQLHYNEIMKPFEHPTNIDLNYTISSYTSKLV